MRLRLLFTLGLVLIMSTIASSNECFRNCRRVIPKTTTTPPISSDYSTLLVNKLMYI
jgi:hypothetical protein